MRVRKWAVVAEHRSEHDDGPLAAPSATLSGVRPAQHPSIATGTRRLQALRVSHDRAARPGQAEGDSLTSKLTPVTHANDCELPAPANGVHVLAVWISKETARQAQRDSELPWRGKRRNATSARGRGALSTIWVWGPRRGDAGITKSRKHVDRWVPRIHGKYSQNSRREVQQQGVAAALALCLDVFVACVLCLFYLLTFVPVYR